MRSQALLLMTRWAIAHMENTEIKFPRFPHLRAVKFAPVVVFFLFFVTNLTGFYFSPVFAPSSVEAKRQDEFIPLDIPQSGDCDLDLIIFRAGERAGVDPRFIHAVIQQESRYDPKATSPVGARGLMQLMPATGKRFDCNDLKDQGCKVVAGKKKLTGVLKRFNGGVSPALSGFQNREGAGCKAKGVPPYRTTKKDIK